VQLLLCFKALKGYIGLLLKNDDVICFRVKNKMAAWIRRQKTLDDGQAKARSAS
jgi:hypothetical protein